ncbi:Fe-S cluster assembly protein SufD [Longirhabdus pacifica]|uniref:Fe-S cluster assembly protein SufD n=1 Tax=Longirhabdus pacifica TaxID=2305227 RepID=UPI0010093656|nr:Fe-S cluster assembly protein SufD [Longirhabdus pacifica]
MTVEMILPIDRALVESLAKHNDEPQWLTQFRLQALEKASSLPLPYLEKTKIEKWNLNEYGQFKSSSKVEKIEDLPSHIKDLLETSGEDSGQLVMHNSSTSFHQLSASLAEQGVIFTDLVTAAREHEDLVKKHLMTAVKVEENRLTALHAALFNNGIFLYIPRNVQVEIPLQALLVADDGEALVSPHILIVADENSAVKYVDHVATMHEHETVHNGIIEVIAKNGAHVAFSSVRNLGAQVTDVTYRRAIVEKDAKIEWVLGEMSYGNIMSDTTSILKGNGSFSDAKVVCVGTNSQKLNVTTRAVHFGRSSDSDMVTRAVMRDEATAIFNGITKIEKGATHANGEQTERVLMLSPKARGDANPMLLIDEDEVTAGHAASAGQVNKEQVYYLMSRGISREEATKLIIYGFLEPVVSEIPIKQVEEQLSSLVERKLGQ